MQQKFIIKLYNKCTSDQTNIATKMPTKRKPSSPPKKSIITEPKEDLMERFHIDDKICDIFPTNVVKKVDLFQEYRPKDNRQYLSYNISETDAKLDAGPTKIHYRQTLADYEPYPPGYVFEEDEPPPPPPKKRKRPSHGRGPVWEFEDEIRMRKIEVEQEIARKELTARLRRKARTKNEAIRSLHEEILALVGPDWFQELSPDQLRTADKFAYCITRDLAEGTTIHTQENIARLGLVLRPNLHHIDVALLHCCNNPVEFLLILYQIMNPKRVRYSLNDKLLLSAVAHLTIRETLRELHIRIPSPPKRKEKKSSKPKPIPKRSYKSPYLVPFTFKPEPPKHTGIYKNTYIQYPESPYFSYIPALRREIRENLSDFGEEERDSPLKSIRTGHGYPTSAFGEPPFEETSNAAVVRGRHNEVEENDEMPKVPYDSIEKEIDEELEAAQVIYNGLTKLKSVPRLLRPSVYKPCRVSLLTGREKLFAPRSGSGTETSSKVCQGIAADDTSVSLTVEVKIIDQYDDKMRYMNTQYEYRVNVEESTQSKVNYFSKHKQLFIIGGIAIDKNGEAIPIITGIVPKRVCRCKPVNVEKSTQSTVSYFSKHKKPFIIGGIAINKNGEAIPIITGLAPKQACRCKRVNVEKSTQPKVSYFSKHKKPFIIGGIAIGKNGEAIPIITGLAPKQVCRCQRVNVEKPIQSKVSYFSKHKKPFIIGGIVIGKKGEAIPIISGLAPKQVCGCLKKEKKELEQEAEVIQGSEENSDDLTLSDQSMQEELVSAQALVEVQPPKPFNCRCKIEAERRLEFIKKQQECQDVCKKTKPNATFIIAGTKADEDDKPVPIIGGVKAEKKCTCLEKFKRRIDRFEDRKMKRDIQDSLKSTKQNYVVSGISEGPDGKPTYILSGLAGEKPCPKCIALREERKREEERLANMPTIPGGRQKYVISGVQQTPEGNVYVISGTVPIEECDCMRLYEGFVKKHGKCLDLFEQYMNKVKTDTEEYLSEMQGRTQEAEEERNERKEEHEEEQEISSSSTPTVPDDDRDGTCYRCNVSPKSSKSEEDLDINVKVELTDIDAKSEVAEQVPWQPTKGSAEMRRFIVLKRIPCELEEQTDILKQSLEVMAQDGYPLAKLPEVHRLPIFKLWMALRCGKFWTMGDRATLMNETKRYCNHLSRCTTKVAPPNLGITVTEGQKYTWRDAKFVRELASATNENYYRRTKRALIADGQEFFPPTFSYELPTKTFRDCFFSYIPAKEEEVFASRPWITFDSKNFAEIRQTLYGRQTC